MRAAEPWLPDLCRLPRLATMFGVAELVVLVLAQPVLGQVRVEEQQVPGALAALPARERAAWTAYIEQSRRLHSRDTAAMNAELRAAGLQKMTRAVYSGPTFGESVERNPGWLQGDSAGRIADAVLTWQTPSGGWSKRTDSLPGRCCW